MVLSVNGMRTANVVDYVHAKGLREGGMDVVVFRDGTEQAFGLVFRASAAAPDAAAILAEVIGMRLTSNDSDLAEPTNGSGEPD